jgi:hypothetical protein
MTEVHKIIAFGVVAIFGVGFIWGIGAWAIRRSPGAAFWTWVAVAQVVAGVQALIGIGLFIAGYRRPVLHYGYGIFPIVALIVAHSVARSPEYADRPWLPFAFAAFVCFGLTLRALATGLAAG